MPALPNPITSPATVDRPAAGAFAFIFTRLPALLRLSCGLFCLPVALAVRTPPVRPELLLPAVAVLTAWSLWYALRAWRYDLGNPLVAVDVALTSAACLAIPILVAPEVLPGEASWIAVLASTTVINAQATAPARLSIPAGLLVVAAYATGAHAAGNSTEARAHAVTLLVQTGCTAMMTAVMRRRIARADTAFVAAQRATRNATVARIAREAERQQNRDLHDTVLATLTMVGQGAVSEPSPALRERCATDLRTLAALAEARSVPHDATTTLHGGGAGRGGRRGERTRRAGERGESRSPRAGDTATASVRRHRHGRGERRRSRFRPGQRAGAPVRPARVGTRPDGDDRRPRRHRLRSRSGHPDPAGVVGCRLSGCRAAPGRARPGFGHGPAERCSSRGGPGQVRYRPSG
ncbi:hypothetical protein [Verrucosispora sioxanthis]|uniref:hypothetical protein n=1 Tax=Verrucosispora sioxanthis TaxID=2499994 RepID=UPI00209DB3CE